MSAINIPGMAIYPDNFPPILGAAIVLDANGEKAAFIFRFPKSGTLQRIGVRTYTITTGGDLAVTIEDVDLTTGDPDGTLYVANATGTLTIADTDDNVTKYCAINGATGVAVVENELASVVLTAPNLFNGQIYRSFGGSGGLFPYTDEYNGGVWAKATHFPELVLEIDGAMYAPYGYYPPAYHASPITWKSSSNPDRRGAKIHSLAKIRVVGISVFLDMDADCNGILYAADGVTVLETVSADKDVRAVTTVNRYLFQFATPHIFEKGAAYRFVILPTEDVNLSLYRLGFTLDGALNPHSAFYGGINFVYTTCNGAPANLASWTDDETYRVEGHLIYDQIIEPAGGSSFIMV